MDFKKYVEENENLNLKQKSEKIDKLANQIFNMISESADGDEELLSNVKSPFPYVIASIFLKNNNTKITKEEYNLYKKFSKKYSPSLDIIALDVFQQLKDINADVLQQVTELSRKTIQTTLEVFNTNQMLELFSDFLVTVASIDNTVGDEEIDHICELMGIKITSKSKKSSKVSTQNKSSKSKNDPAQVFVEDMGATIRRDSNYIYFSIGAIIKNPNKFHIARNIVVKIIGTNSSGSVVFTNSERIYNIDADSNFFFGATYSTDNGSPTNYKILVDAESFEEVEAGTKLFDGIILSNYSKNTDRWGNTTISGTIKSHYNKRLSWCYAHLVFKDKNGKIVGGENFTLDDVFANSEDAFSTNSEADFSKVTSLEHSIDIRM